MIPRPEPHRPTNPRTGKPIKFGRKPRKPGLMHLHFSDFVQHAKMPTIPPSFDYWPKANVALRDVYGNDELGDCAIAMMFHAAGTFTGNATGTSFHATRDQIVAAYSKVGGYVPGDSSTDNGCILTDVFDYWKKTGLPNGEKILGYVSVNASSWKDVFAANYLFENLCFGVGLPDPWVNPFPSDGGKWDVAGVSDSNNGHAFLGCSGHAAGSDAGIYVDTWGERVLVTPAAIAAYAGPSAGGELYSVITSDILAKGQTKAPNGVAWGDLIAAFDSFGGNIPVPASSPPTLAAAETAVKKAFAGSSMLMRPSSALKKALHALEGLTGWPT